MEKGIADLMKLHIDSDVLKHILECKQVLGVGLFGAAGGELMYPGYLRQPIPRDTLMLTQGEVDGQAIIVCDANILFPPPAKRKGQATPNWPAVCGFKLLSDIDKGYVVWTKHLTDPVRPNKGDSISTTISFGLSHVGGFLTVVGVHGD